MDFCVALAAKSIVKKPFFCLTSAIIITNQERFLRRGGSVAIIMAFSTVAFPMKFGHGHGQCVDAQSTCALGRSHGVAPTAVVVVVNIKMMMMMTMMIVTTTTTIALRPAGRGRDS
jgi:hypothetical protein